MPIISFDSKTGKETRKFVGGVIALREKNGYDDSDFFATVYDQEKGTFREVLYATTRFGCDDVAEVDATPDVLEKYREHCSALDKDCAIWKKKQLWKYRHALRNAARISFKQLGRLIGAYGCESETFYGIIALLKVRNFRSEFRKRMAEQVIAWTLDESPKYPTPLSQKQSIYVFGKMEDIPGAIEYNVGIHGVHMNIYAHYAV